MCLSFHHCVSVYRDVDMGLKQVPLFVAVGEFVCSPEYNHKYPRKRTQVTNNKVSHKYSTPPTIPPEERNLPALLPAAPGIFKMICPPLGDSKHPPPLPPALRESSESDCPGRGVSFLIPAPASRQTPANFTTRAVA